ncbi:MAG: universal stress protein [Sphingomonadales bacterium]|nr:universal stress protein [Sphingomonadales bacterium]
MKKSNYPRRILVASDFSAESDRALELAATIARPVKASVHLLHILEVPYTVQLSRDKLRSSMGNTADSMLKKQSKVLKSMLKLPKDSITTEIREGKPLQEILNVASSGSFDLICMGNHISSTLSRLVFDNTTSGVIDLAPCTVLTTTAYRPQIDLGRIMLASSFHEGDMGLLGEVIGLARNLKSRVDVVHVTRHRQFDAQLKMEGLASWASKKYDTRKVSFRYIHGDAVGEGLAKAVESLGSGLVVVSRESRGLLDTLFGSDLIHEMVYRMEIPVMVFPISPEPAKV